MVWFTNNTALILTPEVDQCRSKISLLAASDTFTQRRVRRIGAGSPHANSSVNRATLTTNRLQSQRHDPASLCLYVDSVLCPLLSVCVGLSHSTVTRMKWCIQMDLVHSVILEGPTTAVLSEEAEEVWHVTWDPQHLCSCVVFWVFWSRVF